MPAQKVRTALASFVDRAIDTSPDGCFEVGFDPEFRSDCEIGIDKSSGISRWKPVLQQAPVDFRGLANAVEAPIHEHIVAYYDSYWSGNFEAKTTEGHLSVIQLWNPADFERLIGNLIGHLMAKQRLKQPFTVFFATTDPESELFLSIENDSGKVLLEEPGKPPLREVEADIATFLDRLTPLDSPPVIF